VGDRMNTKKLDRTKKLAGIMIILWLLLIIALLTCWGIPTWRTTAALVIGTWALATTMFIFGGD